MYGDEYDWLIELPKYVDSTLLGADVSRDRVAKLCNEAAQEKFYAVCVNPTHVRFARRELARTPVKLVTVVGFPLGANTTAVKAYETADAVTRGADEIDMVMNVSAFLHRYEDFVLKEISEVVSAADGRPVKIIIEAGLLTDEQKTRAAELIWSAGGTFVKTSTGFFGGATEKDVKLLKEGAGDKLSIKAAGGIRSYEQAVALIKAGADRLGTSTAGAIMDGLRFARKRGKI
jgi:deoxyribose-phosphate aldolase